MIDDLLLLPYALTKPPEPVCHDARDCDEVVGGSEAADWEVSAILDGVVAARRRHILRHDGRW